MLVRTISSQKTLHRVFLIQWCLTKKKTQLRNQSRISFTPFQQIKWTHWTNVLLNRFCKFFIWRRIEESPSAIIHHQMTCDGVFKTVKTMTFPCGHLLEGLQVNASSGIERMTNCRTWCGNPWKRTLCVQLSGCRVQSRSFHRIVLVLRSTKQMYLTKDGPISY